MTVATYSITLNFFLPKAIVQDLKKVIVGGDLAFDWRESEFCHCTVKAISVCNEIPEKEALDGWIATSREILDEQDPFRVSVKGFANFPTALYAGIESDELMRLHRKLCRVLPSSQPQFEDRNYVPHASIGVLNHDVELLSDAGGDFGAFEVREIQLVVFDLGNLNRSIVHHRFSLGGV